MAPRAHHQGPLACDVPIEGTRNCRSLDPSTPVSALVGSLFRSVLPDAGRPGLDPVLAPSPHQLPTFLRSSRTFATFHPRLTRSPGQSGALVTVRAVLERVG